jgi:hypothetical protein
VPENMKLTGEDSKVKYKQEENIKKIRKTENQSKHIRSICEGMYRKGKTKRFE